MVSEVSWSSASRARESCCVRVRWWGEPVDGVLLWPAHASRASRRGTSTASYTLTCGPQQLAKYLMDMRTLVLDVCVETHDAAAAPVTLVGHAYLHLALAHFEAPFCAQLPIYAPNQSETALGVLSTTLLVSYGAQTPQPSVAASFDNALHSVNRAPRTCAESSAAGARAGQPSGTELADAAVPQSAAYLFPASFAGEGSEEAAALTDGLGRLAGALGNGMKSRRLPLACEQRQLNLFLRRCIVVLLRYVLSLAEYFRAVRSVQMKESMILSDSEDCSCRALYSTVRSSDLVPWIIWRDPGKIGKSRELLLVIWPLRKGRLAVG